MIEVWEVRPFKRESKYHRKDYARKWAWRITVKPRPLAVDSRLHGRTCGVALDEKRARSTALRQLKWHLRAS